MLLRLLAAALTPLMRQTHAWISSGVLQEPATEFFIARGEPLLPLSAWEPRPPQHVRRKSATHSDLLG